MEQQVYDDLLKANNAIEMIRPQWTYKPKAYPKDLTVLICQGNRRFLTELCINSLLRFYPDVKVFVMNSSPEDFDSTNYLRYMALKHENIEVYEWSGVKSHGVMMNFAIHKMISTEYILLMDNDVISERGGYIEGMLEQLSQNPSMFAIGTLMVVTRKGDSCGVPEDESDVLRHAHPSCSIIKRSMYLGFRGATDHGAPLCYTMEDAVRAGNEIGSYPVDKYVSHLSGASWTDPRTIWNNDHGVYLRPFMTFIISTPVHTILLAAQTDQSFDMVLMGKPVNASVVIHDSEPVKVSNKLYDLRFRVVGEYVCVLPEIMTAIDNGYMVEVRKEIVKQGLPDKLNIGGLVIVRRDVFQNKDCLV